MVCTQNTLSGAISIPPREQLDRRHSNYTKPSHSHSAEGMFGMSLEESFDLSPLAASQVDGDKMHRSSTPKKSASAAELDTAGRRGRINPERKCHSVDLLNRTNPDPDISGGGVNYQRDSVERNPPVDTSDELFNLSRTSTNAAEKIPKKQPFEDETTDPVQNIENQHVMSPTMIDKECLIDPLGAISDQSMNLHKDTRDKSTDPSSDAEKQPIAPYVFQLMTPSKHMTPSKNIEERDPPESENNDDRPFTPSKNNEEQTSAPLIDFEDQLIAPSKDTTDTFMHTPSMDIKEKTIPSMMNNGDQSSAQSPVGQFQFGNNNHNKVGNVLEEDDFNQQQNAEVTSDKSEIISADDETMRKNNGDISHSFHSGLLDLERKMDTVCPDPAPPVSTPTQNGGGILEAISMQRIPLGNNVTTPKEEVVKSNPWSVLQPVESRLSNGTATGNHGDMISPQVESRPSNGKVMFSQGNMISPQVESRPSNGMVSHGDNGDVAIPLLTDLLAIDEDDTEHCKKPPAVLLSPNPSTVSGRNNALNNHRLPDDGEDAMSQLSLTDSEYLQLSDADDNISICSYDGGSSARHEGGSRGIVAVPSWLKVGVIVIVGNSRRGVVKYVGNAAFKPGVWVGVALESPAGKLQRNLGL